MHIGIVAIGTRGDVQPCIALGLGLQQAGHRVTLVTGQNFVEIVRSHGLGCADIGVDIQTIMQGKSGRGWVDSGPLDEIAHMRRTFMAVAEPIVARLVEIVPRFDAVITGLTILPMTLPITEAASIPMINLLFAPAYPTRSGAATMLPIRPQAESVLNLVTRPVMLRVMWYTGSVAVRMTCRQMGEPPLRYRHFADAWLHTPTLLAASPQVIPPPDDFLDHVRVTGYLFLDRDEGWSPPPELVAFLAAGPPPVYVGFGSMISSGANSLVPLVTEALDGRRAIINRGWAGITADDLPENIYLTGGVPHDWLFPQVSAVVHHGGAGTTAAGLRAGVPAVVVPHIADQPYYGRRVHELGAGPAPIPRRKLTAARLRAAFDDVLNTPSMASAAQRLGERIRAEDGVGQAVRAIECYLG